MKISKALFNFYIQASFHVAFLAVALTWLTVFTLGLTVPFSLLWFVFSATIVGYNFLQYGSLNQDLQISKPSNLKSIRWIIWIAFIAMGWFFLQLPSSLWGWVVLCGMLTLFYAVPVVPGGKNLRAVPGLKIAIITIVWTQVTVIFPMVYFEIEFDKSTVLLLLQRLLFLWVLVLPFEIRDLKNDALSLGTIPQRIGIRNTKILGVVLLAIAGMLEFWLQNHIAQPLQFTYFILAVTAAFLLFSTPQRSKNYTSFWVDAIPVFWFLLEFLFSN